jgi:hypothetical protein
MVVFPRHLVVLSAFVLAIGCNGLISDAGEAPGRPADLDPSDPAFCERAAIAPGHVTIRRLNRTEYNNTVRDLLGTTTTPGDDFPEDDESGDGFDNNGTILTLGNLLMEKYETAARALATEALAPGSLARTRFLDCDAATMGETECARDFAERFGLRAFRRPATTEEVDRIVALYEAAKAEGETHDAALALAMRGMLMSPSFIYRVEVGGEAADASRLDDFALASRLSYFLWSSMPDDELMNLAAEGVLQDEEEIRVQVDRMLASDKADAFYESFAGQWLHLRRFEYAAPNAELFPEFDDQLRRAMEQETLLFVRHVVESNAPLSTLLRADFTFLNERLANHYGIEGVSGDALQFVSLETRERGGLLTQGAILTTTSHPDRTSPVRRGEWVLDNLLCAPPPDPPADVDTFLETEDSEGQSLREKLERHRADPACAACHDLMDPIGFGMEAFDPIGRFRTEDRYGNIIDATGTLPGGTAFDGVAELSGILHEDERYTTCVTEKVLTFALGRSLEGEDRCFVEQIVEAVSEVDTPLRGIIQEIAINEVFRSTGGREEVSR